MQTVCDNLVTGVQSMTVHRDLLPLAHNSSFYTHQLMSILPTLL